MFDQFKKISFVTGFIEFEMTNLKFLKKFKIKRFNFTVSILLCWSFGIITGLLPFFGWRNEILHSHDNSCSFTKIKSTSYFLFRNITITVIPLILMALIYSIIYVKVRKVRKFKFLELVSWATRGTP